MTTQIKRRRGTTTQHSSFTGAEGELTIDTTKDTVVVHDGITSGGHPLAKESSITGKVDKAGDTMTGDLGLSGADVTFGDNDKAIFGAGSDLAVFSNGTDSFIQEYTTGGHLYIDGTNILMRNRSDGSLRLQTSDSGAVDLYHSGSSKLTTTSTGVDVTGTLTSDDLRANELTVDDGGSNTNIRLQNTNSGSGGSDGFLIQHATNAKTYVWNYENADIIFGTNATERMRIDSSGNVGIGTSSPAANRALHISSTAQNQARFERTGSATSQIEFEDSTTTNQPSLGGVGDDLTFRTAFTERMRISSAGNVGIGTSSPDLVGSTTSLTIDHTGGNGQLSLMGNGTVYGRIFADNATGDLKMGNPTSNDVMFYTANLERMRIDSSGNVGIGHSPTYKVDVAGTNPALRLKSSSGFGYIIDQNTSNGLVSHIVYENVGMRFGTNSAERMRITSAGNVGIGTSSPATPLDVTKAGGGNFVATFQNTTSATPYGVHIKDASSGANGYPLLQVTNSAGSSAHLLVHSGTGKVGIGNASPQRELHIGAADNINHEAVIVLNNGGATGYRAGLEWRYEGNTTPRARIGVNASNQILEFDTAGSERMRLDASGNLLVGKTSTSSNVAGHRLNPRGDIEATRSGGLVAYLNRQSSDGDIAVFAKDGTTVGSIGVYDSDRLYIADQSNGLQFDQTTIRPCNNTGVNTDDVVTLGSGGSRFKDLYLSNSVKVTTATNGTSIIDLGDTSDSNIGRIAYDNSVDAMYFKTNNSERMRLDANGNLLVGTTGVPDGTSVYGSGFISTGNNRRTLHLATSSTADNYLIRFYNPNGAVGQIRTNGSSTSYATSSDYRLKTDAQPMTGASARVQALNPVNFEWIADGTRVDGFLAHEAQAVVPEAVTGTKDAMRDEEYEVTPAVTDDDGNVVTEAVMGTRSIPDYQGIDQSKLVPLLTAALQEALTKIDALETRITALEG